MKSFAKIFMIGLKYLKKKVYDEDHICAAGFIMMFSLMIPYEIMRTKSLNNHTAYTVGVIYKIKLDRNPGKLYEFYVGDSIFRGRAGYGGLSKIVEGDSIFVAYDYTNPGNSEIVGYFEYALDRSKLPDTVFYRRQMNKMRKPLE